MYSISQVPLETLFNTHFWLTTLLKSQQRLLSEDTQLQLRKTIAKQLAYPIETQLLLAQVVKKYYWMLEIQNRPIESPSKKIEAEWLKIVVLNNPDEYYFEQIDHSFTTNVLKSMLTEEIHPSVKLVESLANSNLYLEQKFAVQFLKKALFESYFKFDSAKRIIDILLHSKSDAIVIGAISIIADFPVIYKSFPEKEFWLLSERSETIQKTFFSILKYWGDNPLFTRVLKGDSWSIPLKLVIVKHVAAYPSQAYANLLMGLLNNYPIELGPLILEVLYTYKLSGISFTQKKQRQLLRFWMNNKVISVQKIAELTRELNEADLTEICFEENIEWCQVIDLFEALNTKVSKRLLIQYFKNNKNQPTHLRILNAFINMNCIEAENEIIAQFDSFPEQSTNALYFLGGKKTEIYLKEKLGFNTPANKKVNYYSWEVEAVRFLIEISTDVNQLLTRLTEWNVPYLNKILVKLNPKADTAFFDSVSSYNHEVVSVYELKSIINKLVEFKDPRGLTFFKELLIQEDETIRDSAFSGMNELIRSLYDNRKLTQRQLLFFDRETAVLSCQTTILLTILANKGLDFTKQEIILNYLLLEVDEIQVLEQLPELFLIGNLHIEKLVIQLVGNMSSERGYRFLIPYLNFNQDIFRLRQALITAEKSGSSVFESKILELLGHRNMNVKKAAVDYCKKSGSFLSVAPLFHLLKTNDNPGLRKDSIKGLKSILAERYFTFLFNSLLDCSAKREKELLISCFTIEEKDKAIWICEQENNQELLGYFAEQETFKTEDFEPFRKKKIDDVLLKLMEVTKDVLTQTKFEKALNELNETEVILILPALRELLVELDKPVEFLLQVLYDCEGLVTEDIAYKGIGANNPAIRKWAAAELVQHKKSFKEGMTIGFDDSELQIVIDYFYPTEKNKILDWLKENPRKLAHCNLINQFESWEYANLITETSEVSDLKPSLIKQLKFFNCDLFNSLIFQELHQQQQFDFIFSLNNDELKRMHYPIHYFYRNLKEENKLRFLESAALKKGFEVLTNQEKHLLIDNGWKHFRIEELSLANHNELKIALLKILDLNRKEFTERREELKRRLNHFKNDQVVLNLLFSKMCETGLLFEKECTDLIQFIKEANQKGIWNMIYPDLRAGNYALLNLLKRHNSVHENILKLLEDWNLERNTAILKWLNSYDEETIYFPNLFAQLIREEEHKEYVAISVQLMFKLCCYDSSYHQSIFEFIQNQLFNKGEARQHLILDLMLEKAPNKFLCANDTRNLLLKCDSNAALKSKAARCILKAINLNKKADRSFLLGYLNHSKNSLTTQLMKELVDSIEELENAMQLEIYNELLDIPSMEERGHEGMLRLFGTDYQIITLLSEEKRNHFFENLRKDLFSINDEAYLRAIIKSMRLYEIDGYTDLIESLLHKHGSSKIRSLCLRELKKHLEKSTYLEICKTLLDHKDIGILRQVIKTLAFAKEANIVPRLLPLLESKKNQFNTLAKDAILLLDHLALPYLKKELNKCRPDKREGLESLIKKIVGSRSN